jgi:4-carboxymuconolactone decarboxylase
MKAGRCARTSACRARRTGFSDERPIRVSFTGNQADNTAEDVQRMNRILEIPPDQLTPEQTAIFDQLTAGRGRILGPYKIWIHSPPVASGMERIGTFLNKRSSLSKREVEIVILVIAQHWQGDYVRQAHVREGKAAGLTQETIDAILAGDEPGLADAHERAVHRFAAALVSGTKLSDVEFAELEKVLGRNGIAEVLVLLGYYTSVALAMKVHEVPIPQPNP